MLEGLQPPTNKSVYCKVAQIIDKLEPADQAILEQALSNPKLWPASTLSKALRTRGLSMADTTITKHRLKTCACNRD